MHTTAVLSSILPADTRLIIASKLRAALATIARCHGHPDRWPEERRALGQLARISDLVFDDADRLPMSVRRILLARDLEAACLPDRP